ncbi:MAG: RNA polymerase sigma factor [Phycisphaerales bacterium]
MKPAPANEPRGEEPSTTALVIAARSGDRVAMACFYARFAPLVHAVLLARVDHADADDLTQEVFVRAFDRLEALQEPEAAGGWLAAIARHAAVTLARGRKPREDADPSAAGRARGESGPVASAEASEALAAIRALPEAYRQTLLLRLVEGLTGPEIAARTGMTHGSVRVHLHRGFALLRERLGMSAEESP